MMANRIGQIERMNQPMTTAVRLRGTKNPQNIIRPDTKRDTQVVLKEPVNKKPKKKKIKRTRIKNGSTQAVLFNRRTFQWDKASAKVWLGQNGFTSFRFRQNKDFITAVLQDGKRFGRLKVGKENSQGVSLRKGFK